MSETVIQIRVDVTAEIYQRGRQYLRVTGDDGEPGWVKRTSRGLRPVSDHRARRLERAHRNPATKKVRRIPRRTAEDVARFRTAWLISALEKRAHNWIGRGLKANIKLGRIFIRLKELVGELVGHGHFEAYYKRTFEKDGIPFRTAQGYMLLVRKKDKVTNSADSALFPQATDPQAVEIREATEAHQLAVADAQSDSSDEAPCAHEHRSGHADESGESKCICRPSLHVTPDQKVRISALWRSEHRSAAETEVIDLLIELCDRYHGSSDSSSSSEEEEDA